MSAAPMAAGMAGMFPFGLQQPEKKPTGMFGAGKGNIGEILSAAIFGALAGRGNAAGTVGLQALHQRRRDAHESEMAQQNRENEFQDFVRKESWRMANQQDDPTGYAKDLIAAGHQPGSPEFQRLYGQYVQAKAQSGGSLFGPRFTDPATGQTYMMGGQSNLPPIGAEIDDPRQGGPTPRASGGFPF